MSAEPAILGGLLGAGILLIFMGVKTLTDKKRDDAGRKRGFWPLNAGLILAAISMYLFASAG
jgi:hypothetical protein